MQASLLKASGRLCNTCWLSGKERGRTSANIRKQQSDLDFLIELLKVQLRVPHDRWMKALRRHFWTGLAFTWSKYIHREKRTFSQLCLSFIFTLPSCRSRKYFIWGRGWPSINESLTFVLSGNFLSRKGTIKNSTHTYGGLCGESLGCS